jgi:hypothetical protein
MAYYELSRVKRSMVEALAAIMPNNEATGQAIPVHYAWPGSQRQAPVHVWFVGGRTVSSPSTMRAGRKRRDQTTTFDIVVECNMKGPTLDEFGVNVLQEQADQVVEEIVGLIDEWIADNPQLGQTTSTDVPIDYATFDSSQLAHGPLDNGCASIALCTVSYRLRPL